MDRGVADTAGGYPESSHGEYHQNTIPVICGRKRQYKVSYRPSGDDLYLDTGGPYHSSPAKRRTIALRPDFGHLLTPQRFAELRNLSELPDGYYDGRIHSQYATSIKHHTLAYKRPLSRNERDWLLPPLLQAFKPSKSWSWRSLTTIVHSFTSAGLFTEQQLTNEDTRPTQGTLLSDLLDAVLHKCSQEPDVSGIDTMGIANLMWSLARLVDNSQELTPRFKEVTASLLSQVRVMKDDFKPMEITNILWAMAKLTKNRQSPTPGFKETMAALLPGVSALQDRFKPLETSNLLWAMAKLVDNGHGLTPAINEASTALLTRVIRLKHLFYPQHIATLLWAMAKLIDNGYERPPGHQTTMAVLLTQVDALKDQFNAQSTANLLWAMAKLVDNGQKLTPEFKQALATLLPRLNALKNRFNVQEIANLLWAVAKLVNREDELATGLEEVVVFLLSRVDALKAHFNPQEITSLLRAMAKLVDNGWELTPKFKEAMIAVLPHASALKDRFTPQEIANLLWAMGKLVDNGQELTTDIKETTAVLLPRVIALKDQFVPRYIANLLWATAKLVDNGYQQTPILKEAMATQLPRVPLLKDEFKPQGIANLLWAMTRLADSWQEPTSELKEAVTGLLLQVSELKADLDSQEITNLLLTIGTFGELIETATTETLVDYLTGEPDKFFQFTAHELSVSLWGLLVCSARLYLAHTTSNDMLECLMNRLFTHLENQPIDSEREKSVIALAARWLGKKCLIEPHYRTSNSNPQHPFHTHLQSVLPSLKIEQEVSLQSLPPVDLFIAEHNIAIEIQGPSRYVGHDFQTRNGSTLLKIALLQKAKYDVLEIPASQLQNPDSVKTYIDHIRQKTLRD